MKTITKKNKPDFICLSVETAVAPSNYVLNYKFTTKIISHTQCFR